MKEQLHCGGALVNSDNAESCGGTLGLSESEQELWNHLNNDEDDDYVSYDDFLYLQESQFTGQTLMPFVAKRVNRRIYRKGKTNHTKCRIAGAILHILESAKGAKCYPTCKRVMSYTGFSESTVRRHLYDVLDWLVIQGRLLLEIDPVKGYVAYTQEWLDMTTAHGDVLAPSKFVRSPWLKRSQIPFANLLKKHPTPPVKTCPNTKRGIKIPFSKKRNLNNAGVAPAMMRLASSLLSKQPARYYNRFKPTQAILRGLLGKVLSLGHWRKDAVCVLHKAIRITDTAMSDFHINNPVSYCYGVMIEQLPTTPPTRTTIKNECSRFWKGELSKFRDLMTKEGLTDSPAFQVGLRYYSKKIILTN